MDCVCFGSSISSYVGSDSTKIVKHFCISYIYLYGLIYVCEKCAFDGGVWFLCKVFSILVFRI